MRRAMMSTVQSSAGRRQTGATHAGSMPVHVWCQVFGFMYQTVTHITAEYFLLVCTSSNLSYCHCMRILGQNATRGQQPAPASPHSLLSCGSLIVASDLHLTILGPAETHTSICMTQVDIRKVSIMSRR